MTNSPIQPSEGISRSTYRNNSARNGIAICVAALTISCTAAIFSFVLLLRPMNASLHTVIVTALPQQSHSTTEIQQAKETACTAWDRTSRATGAASRTSAALLNSNGWENADSQRAIDNEKIVGISMLGFLKTQFSGPIPDDTRNLIEQWNTVSIDMLHQMNRRQWDNVEQLRLRGNELVHKIVDNCGLN